MLVDRGHLAYDMKISTVWPDFGAQIFHSKMTDCDQTYRAGMRDMTIAQLMRHECGLKNFDRKLPLEELTTDRLRRGSVSQIIAQQVPSHVCGESREYHSITRGFIANEIVRRADPAGRTVAQFLEQEIAKPLGLEGELSCGVQEKHWHKVAQLTHSPLWWIWGQMLLPQMLGGGKLPVSSTLIRLGVLGVLPLLALSKLIKQGLGYAEKEKNDEKSDEKGEGMFTQFNSEAWRRAEIPSVNMHASGRALAKLAAVIVEGGAVSESGARLLSTDSVAEAHSGVRQMPMFGGYLDSHFTNAGWNDFKDGRMGYVGWMGAGGSVMQWHPEHRIGFGYAMNLMEVTPTNERGRALQAAALQCAQQQV